MPHIYYSYLNTFISDLELSLPDIRNASCGPEQPCVTVRVHEKGSFDQSHKIYDAPMYLYHLDTLNKFCRIIADDAGEIIISNGNYVEIFPVNDAKDSVLEMYFLGIVMAIVLYQKGLFVLHACALQIKGKTIAIVGESGHGKSTLTAALISRGHGFLGDDVVAIDFVHDRVCIAPGSPLLKVDDEVARQVGFAEIQKVGKHPYKGKNLFSMDLSATDWVELDHLFVLNRGDFSFQPISPKEALMHLICHSVPTRWGVKSDRVHFNKCFAFSTLVPVTSFQRQFDIQSLGDQAKSLEAFLDNL